MTKHTLILSCMLSLGCSTATDVQPTGGGASASSKLVEGSPEALGMLDFLNDAGTTFELLDEQVGLDRRAAQSLISHRNGADGELGRYGDDLFDSIEEVDACWFVGAKALERIQEWALTHDWIALDDNDHLGTWDGVAFTVAEADATVALANTASEATLDDELGLDSRAVNSILDARDIETVQQLAGLYYVGGSALTILKDAAAADDCANPGWDVRYIYDEGDDAWRNQLPAEYVAIVDEVLGNDAWCGESTGSPWFVKATMDVYDCQPAGFYTIELGQGMLEYPEISWYIEFEVDADFSWFHSTCEV